MIAPTLDVAGVDVTLDACQRFCTRRGWGLARLVDADRQIRKMLTEHRGPMPPARVTTKNGLSRRFVVGGMAFVTDASCTTLLTLYPVAGPRREPQAYRTSGDRSSFVLPSVCSTATNPWRS